MIYIFEKKIGEVVFGPKARPGLESCTILSLHTKCRSPDRASREMCTMRQFTDIFIIAYYRRTPSRWQKIKHRNTHSETIYRLSCDISLSSDRVYLYERARTSICS